MDEQLISDALGEWRTYLYLEHWTCNLFFKELEDYAETEMTTNRFTCNITFDNKLLTDSVEEINNTICHELLHLLFRPLYPGILEYIKFQSHDFQESINTFQHSEIEQIIDHMAGVLAGNWHPECFNEWYVKPKRKRKG